MPSARDLYISATIALVGGIILAYRALFFLTGISYSMGVISGLGGAIKAYNITPSNTIAALISGAPSLNIAAYIAYAILPFALVIIIAGIFWLFIRSYVRAVALIAAFSSIAAMLLIAILEFSLSFSEPVSVFEVSYLGAILGIAASAYVLVSSDRKAHRKIAKDFEVNPDTPYTNILQLSSKVMSKLSGEIKILDTHFDANGLKNLARLIGSNKGYTSILVLTKPERLSSELASAYYDFKKELENKGIAFEMRVMADADAAAQHERLLMDSAIAYKIPPLNIINKKSEHIVGISHGEAERRFNELWNRATKYENYKRDKQ